MSEDKRKFPRASIKITTIIDVNENGGRRASGNVIDLTVEGISLQVAIPFAVGERVTIYIQDSRLVRKNKLQGEIVRCDPSQTDPVRWIIAAKFIEPNDEFLMDALALVHGRKSTNA